MTEASPRLRMLQDAAAWGFVALTMLCALAPFSPGFPGSGLDPSWVFAMNEAAARKMVFGREIVFTFGPYASLYTFEYHPGINHLTMVGGLFLALSYFLAAILAGRGSPRYVLVLLALTLAGLHYSRETIFLFYPLLAALAVYASCLAATDPRGGRLASPDSLAPLLFANFGLILAVKGSYAPMIIATLAACCGLYWIFGRQRAAVISLACAGAGLVCFWMYAGQELRNLPAYFWNMIPLVTGFTEAMADSGNVLEIVTFLFWVGLLCTLILTSGARYRAFLLAVFGLFLFINFKHAFVRHDGGHAMSAALSIVLSCIALLLTTQRKVVLLAMPVALACCFFIISNYLEITPRVVAGNVLQTYVKAAEGVKTRLGKEDVLAGMFHARREALGQALPMVQGSADIYPWDQADLIASGNAWNPRPVLQSYSAYTGKLAAMNANHLTGPRAPDNIFFRVQTIDGRHPALDDGPSWPLLLAGYEVQTFTEKYVHLRKKSKRDALILSPVVKKNVLLGDSIVIPDHSVPLYANIKISRTLVGHAIASLFKLPDLTISVNMSSGSSEEYRIVSKMVESGFIISPHLDNLQDFIELFQCHENNKFKNNVVSIIVNHQSNTMGHLAWKKKIEIELYSIYIL